MCFFLKMFTSKNTSEQEIESAESASVATMKKFKRIENVENWIMDISEDFLSILKLSFNILKDTQARSPNKKQNKEIRAIVSTMDRLFHDIISSKDPKTNEIVILVQAFLFLSYVYLNAEDNEKTNIYETYIMKCVELLREKEMDHNVIITAVRAYHYLGHVSFKQNNPEEALSFYDKAVQLHLSYTKEQEEYLTPVDIVAIFKLEQQKAPKILLNDLFILSLEATLNAYSYIDLTFKQRDVHKIATYKHTLLKKQLNSELLAANIEFIKWAEELASLSLYFINFKRFTEARNHLALASCMIKKFYENVYVNTDRQKYPIQKVSMYEMYQNVSAYVARYWAKYGIQLLHSSQQRTLQDKENDLGEVSNLKTVISIISEEKPNKLLIFADVEKYLEECNDMITDKYISNYKDAKKVFVKVLEYLNEAKTYYTSEKFNEMYALITLDISRAYRYLARYEKNRTYQIKMHKLQIEILKNVLKILNMEYNANTCRLIYLNLAIVHSILLELKIEDLEMYNKLPEKVPGEIKELTTSNMRYCQLYLGFD